MFMQRSEPQPVDGYWQTHPPRTQLAAKFVSRYLFSLPSLKH